MAQVFNFLLAMVVVFAKRNEAIGGIEEELETLQAKQGHVLANQQQPSYSKNLDQLITLLKTDTLKGLCESEKVNPIWCQYKKLLELNTAYEQHKNLVKRKSSGSGCWPGLPLPCKPAARLARAVKNDHETNNDSDTQDDTNNVNETENYANNYAAAADDDEEKRAMKCRPGMVNCRRKKKGKRTIDAVKSKRCPQGWMFCL